MTCWFWSLMHYPDALYLWQYSVTWHPRVWTW